jgi:LysM repeat protein
VNGLSNDTLRPGQILNIPASGTKAPEPIAAKPQIVQTKLTARSYTVKSGDRLIFIAKKFNVSTEELIAYNKISDPGKLQIGQTLKIPGKK